MVDFIEVNGHVGHHGKHGCWKGCSFQGWHKSSTRHYYSVHLKPNIYSVQDCDQLDFNFWQFEHQLSPEIYNSNLLTIMNSLAQGDYEHNQKNTGISKASILSGLLSSHMLKISLCFTVNLMHLICLSVSELLIFLWQGTIQCEATNSKWDWDWTSQLMDNNIWQVHGKLVASVTKYFPSFFHHPPQNPGEKISSGYKATKYYLYIFGLGPRFFQTVLPKKYWRNFCLCCSYNHAVFYSGSQNCPNVWSFWIDRLGVEWWNRPGF